MSLYRKYRPKKFSEVIGQEHVVQTLKGAIESNQVGHAYIFTGIRGTGKTSIARIFAKSLDCLNFKDGEPCDQCSVCSQITEGSFLDLIEIDAASNRGIDEIRDLKEKIRFAPNIGKYKIYIIDEVHMLTEQAFNALLKTIEEPPSHAIFILATTEIHKIPVTILSRCQRLDFHKVKKEKMLDGIKRIVEKEGIKIDEKSLKKIISISEGSVRDTLSHLDQINSFAGGKEINLDLIEDILGYSKEEKLFNLLEFIISKDTKKVISFINDFVEEGRDLENFIKDFIRFIRNILIFKIDKELVKDISEEEEFLELLNKISFKDLVVLIENLNGVLKNSKFSFLPQLLLEIELIKFINSEKSSNSESKNETKNIPSRIVSEIKNVLKQSSNYKNENEKISESKNIELEKKQLFKNNNWEEFMNKIKKEKIILYMALQDCEVENIDKCINLGVSNEFYFNRLNEKNNFDFIMKIFNEFYSDKELKIKRLDKKIENRDLLKDALSVFGGELIE